MPPDVSTPPTPLLDVRNLDKSFATSGLFSRGAPVVAARKISFRIDRGEAVALVGESGSGKSTVARLLLRLERPDGGEILLDGDDILSRPDTPALMGYRRRVQMIFEDNVAYRKRVQMIFQDPFGSLNPVHDVGHHLTRPLLRHGRSDSSGARAAALELLRTVGLEPAEEFIDRHPYELSGGQRQRVAIARALAVAPDLLIADEPTSMLDVSIRMGILNLLAQLKHERGVAILLITHDLASAHYLCERILVLFRGRVVEDGPSGAVVASPAHPYTRALLGSIAGVGAPGAESPDAIPAAAARPDAQKEAPSAEGCPFLNRCPDVLDICARVDPLPRPRIGGGNVRCHLYPEAAPAGRG